MRKTILWLVAEESTKANSLEIARDIKKKTWNNIPEKIPKGWVGK